MAERHHGAREWSSVEGWRTPGSSPADGVRGYDRRDDDIRGEITDRIAARGCKDVECQVVDGEVTLTGFVDSRRAKRAAEDLAAKVYGVRNVHNHLQMYVSRAKDGVAHRSRR